MTHDPITREGSPLGFLGVPLLEILHNSPCRYNETHEPLIRQHPQDLIPFSMYPAIAYVAFMLMFFWYFIVSNVHHDDITLLDRQEQF